MLNILFYLLFLLAAFGILVLLHKAIRALAYPVGERYLHCRMLLAIFIGGLVLTNFMTLSIPEILVWKLIGMDSLESFWGTILPQRFYELSFFTVTVLLLNMIVLAGILLVTALIRILFMKKRAFFNYRTCRGFGRIRHLPWALAMPFFEEEEEGKASLNGIGFSSGRWAGGMKNAFLILGLIEMAASVVCIIVTPKSLAPAVLKAFCSLYMLPAFGYEIASQTELMLYAERENRVGKFSSEDIDIVLAGSSYDLAKGYMLQFQTGSALLYMGKIGPEGGKKGGLESNDLENQQLEDCSRPEILSMIMTQMRDRGIRLEAAYQNALIALLNGQSVCIRDILGGEFVPYLAAYLNYQMSRNNTALLLTADDPSAERLADLLEKEMHALNEIHSVWTIRTARTLDRGEEISILCCSWQTFVERHIVDIRPAFINRLCIVGLMDGLSVFSRDPVRIAGLFSDLERTGRDLQYLMMTDIDSASLRDACSYYINEPLLPFKADRVLPATIIMVWKKESSCRMQKQLGIGNDSSEYLGTALPLALTGARFDMGKVYIMRGEDAGISTFMAAGAREATDIRRYVNKSGINLSSVIRLNEDELKDSEEITDLIVCDAHRNLMQTFWQWSKYGGSDGTVMHIVSPSGMLRDFFADNFEKFRNNSGQFDIIIPHRQALQKSQMAVMLMELCDRGVTEEYLMAKNEEFHWGFANVFELLRDCLAVAIRQEEVHNIMESLQFDEEKVFAGDDRGFVKCTRITLTDRNVRMRLMERIGYAVLVRMGEQESFLPFLKGNLYNYYLRDQVIAVGGELLYCASVEGGRVIAEPRLLQDLPEYHTVSDLFMDLFELADACSDSREIDWNLYRGNAERRIYGYWESSCGSTFAGRKNGQFVSMLDSDGLPLKTSYEDIPILQIRIRKDLLGSRADEAACLLALMLNETFKTLFPGSWQNILAVTNDSPDESFYKDLISLEAPEELVRSIIPSAAMMPEDPDYAIVYVAEISCLELGLVKSLYEERRRVLTILTDYLAWFLEEESTETAADPDGIAIGGHDALRSFLKFGMDDVPLLLAPRELYDALRTQVHSVEEEREPAVEGISVSGHRCSFCGSITMMPYRMKAGDGRIMCRDCREHRVEQKEEVLVLYEETLRFLEETFRIRLRRDINVRFQSAATIRKATASSTAPGGRVLGFYMPALRELWIESRGPRIAVQDTIIHEITHSWQYDNLDMERLKKKLGPEKFLILVEGHAVCLEVRTMQALNQMDFAARIEAEFMSASDEYGVGYRMLKDYIAEKEAEGSHYSPYSAMAELCRAILANEITF